MYAERRHNSHSIGSSSPPQRLLQLGQVNLFGHVSWLQQLCTTSQTYWQEQLCCTLKAKLADAASAYVHDRAVQLTPGTASPSSICYKAFLICCSLQAGEKFALINVALQFYKICVADVIPQLHVQQVMAGLSPSTVLVKWCSLYGSSVQAPLMSQDLFLVPTSSIVDFQWANHAPSALLSW